MVNGEVFLNQSRADMRRRRVTKHKIKRFGHPRLFRYRLRKLAQGY
jgi:hypothetical protein